MTSTAKLQEESFKELVDYYTASPVIKELMSAYINAIYGKHAKMKRITNWRKKLGGE